MIKKIFLICSFTLLITLSNNEKISAQEPYSVAPILEDIRKNYDKNNFNEIYENLAIVIKEHPLELSWFYYAIFAESAYKTGQTGSLSSKLPPNLNMTILARSMIEWSKGNYVVAAGLLSDIKHLSPSLSYLIGKMYYAEGKRAEGAAYFSHASSMDEAPYGSYYYGITQAAEGHHSKAVRALKSVINDTEKEPQLHLKAQLQLIRAYYGNADYSDAYEIAIKLFPQHPQKVMDHMDPGLILTSLKKHGDAKRFWMSALKQSLNNSTKTMIRDRLELNKYLSDPSYPPKWMR